MSGLGPGGKLARWAYTGLYLPAMPFLMAYWMRRPDSRERLGQYFGSGAEAIPKGGDPPCPFWVHAVSAGETVAVMPILRSLREAGHTFFLTTTISDAEESAARHEVPFQGVSFMPLDVPWFQGRLLDHLQPMAVLISETDLWPNFLLEVKARQIPAYLVNGRISEKVCSGWSRIRSLVGAEALDALRFAFVQGEGDRDRLVAMGYPRERVQVVGNTKYELGEPPPLPEEAARLVQKLSELDRPVILGGSTHAPEEEYLLDALPGAPGTKPLLLLAPRNIQRAAEIHALAGDRGRRVGLWSQIASIQGDPDPYDVLVVDTMGQLSNLYAVADVAYIGGGFGDTGGHNFLEAAYHGCPVIGGPDFRNFAGDVEVFTRAGAFLPCSSAGELQEELWFLLEDPERSRARGVRGRELLERGQKATAVTVEKILQDVQAHPPPWLAGDLVT